MPHNPHSHPQALARPPWRTSAFAWLCALTLAGSATSGALTYALVSVWHVGTERSPLPAMLLASGVSWPLWLAFHGFPALCLLAMPAFAYVYGLKDRAAVRFGWVVAWLGAMILLLDALADVLVLVRIVR